MFTASTDLNSDTWEEGAGKKDQGFHSSGTCDWLSSGLSTGDTGRTSLALQRSWEWKIKTPFTQTICAQSRSGERQISPSGGRNGRNCPTGVPGFTEEVVLEMTLEGWGDLRRY